MGSMKSHKNGTFQALNAHGIACSASAILMLIGTLHLVSKPIQQSLSLKPEPMTVGECLVLGSPPCLTTCKPIAPVRS